MSNNRSPRPNENHVLAAFKEVRAFSIKMAAKHLAAILGVLDRTMTQANHLRFSCTPNMSLTIYATIFSGPLMTTDTPQGLIQN